MYTQFEIKLMKALKDLTSSNTDFNLDQVSLKRCQEIKALSDKCNELLQPEGV